MSIRSSFPKVADQVISFNKNIVDILTKINSLTTTTDSSVDVQITDEEGEIRNFTLPSFTSLKSDIERLNSNIESLYNINDTGAMIQTSSANKFRKVITLDLNRDPSPVSSLGVMTSFKSRTNWFFDNLLDPLISVEIDLSGKVEDNIRKCLVRRYIVEFERDSSGELTPSGQAALNSYNELWRGNANIVFSDFENWHRTTNGVITPNNPRIDQNIFDLEPNSTQFDGEFSVLRTQEDRINRKLWYVLDTLDYVETDSGEVRQLSIDDEVIINSDKSSTRYKVLEVSLNESNPRVRFQRVEGLEPISAGIKTLKIYSPILYTKKLRVSLGYNERNVVFIKPMYADTNLMAKKWSLGTGYYTNDLRLNSDSEIDGLSMEEFYTNYVFDYGEALQDLVSKKIPNKLGQVPEPPELNIDNFKVIQVNKHLTDTPDSKLIKQKNNYKNSLKSEIEQLQNAIQERNQKIRVSRFQSRADRKKSQLELKELIDKKQNKSRLLASTVQEILDLRENPNLKVEPKFKLRGFWSMPEALLTRGGKPQEIIQFRVEYRYLSKDGNENPIESFEVNEQEKASFSNWVEYLTGVRKRVFDPESGEYFWEPENLESSEEKNINQIDIPISSGEKVEFRIKSISEVGWPESAIESEWSPIYEKEFPDDLETVNENTRILNEANKEDLSVNLENELEAKGVNDLISRSTTVNDKTFYMQTEDILSGFKDSNGVAIDLFEYLRNLEDKVKGLQEAINRTRGELEVIILRNNQEFSVKNGSETVFNIECEDYLERFTGEGIPSGRVYENSIYVIKDFVVRVINKSTNSPLGLLSDKSYLSNQNIYNTNSPQVFWVNEQDELLSSERSGRTRTQINNQFLWMVNFDTVSQNSASKLADNIGNDFIDDSNNSITDILSSTEYNIGYNENDVLNFVGNNKSLLDPSKWIDSSTSVSSSNKLLTTIHPVIKDLENITENNTSKVKSIDPGEDNSLTIPLNIYFKMNALDFNQSGLNYKYIDLNNTANTIKHIKKVKFLLENESENRPFEFVIKFNMNRSKVLVKKSRQVTNRQLR